MNKRITVPGIAVSLVTALSASAAAQPGALPIPPPAAPAEPASPPPPTAAPDRTEATYPPDPADVSQIDGHPVPVGEHNDYHYTFKRWMVGANPLGWMFGLYGANVSYALGNNVAIRAEVDVFHSPFGDSGTKGGEFDLTVPIYLRRTYQGIFLEPGIMVRGWRHDYEDPYYSEHSSESQIGPECLVGWQNTWDSGLSFAIAVGGGNDFSSSSEDREPFGNGYMRFGYAF